MDLPDIPGKGLVTGTARLARGLVAGAGSGALAVGGFVAKRVLDRDGGEGRERPIARPVVKAAPPVARVAPPVVKAAPPLEQERRAPAPRATKPKASKPKPKPRKPKPAKPEPKPRKSKASKPKPKPRQSKAAKPRPGAEPGDQRGGRDPHHALNNPVADPDETEYPDPYDKRPDPRDPLDPDDAPFGAEPHPATGAESTSEPPPAQDPEVGDRAEPPRRENLDD